MSEENSTKDLPQKPSETQHDEPKPMESLDKYKLNERQKMFVAEYLTDFNATRAAKQAGYSEKTAYSTGHELLKHPEVSRALRAEVKERRERLALDADDLVLMAVKIYNMATVAEPVLAWNGEEMAETGRYNFDGQAANKSLETLGKLLGAFPKDVKPAEGQAFTLNIYGAAEQPRTIEHDPRKPVTAAPGLPAIHITVPKDGT